ncbi:ABC transporter permease [Halarcobacter anaerophilus]|jgi:ABC-2 type transport system permease protein|uniref:ABC transporter permease n=1 Tax=Halarcobacter anaerophilus TaxID=877500 RepID=A0A4Q0Y0Y9_9BACT|nr:ABC transporter permease [Halarcobacter anaerophilus]QDF28534.1 multidrug resistance ABC transporter, permease protein [Halarcobacter anaerophilus]RXJ63263.1 ABC transporter permease [Halarcobacter anaerophilus]
MFYQLLALIRKEFLAIWSDKRSRIVIISPPLIQLVLFSFAVTLEVKNISIGVLDRDNSNQSKEFIRSLKYSDRFSEVLYLKSNKDLQEKLDSQKIMVAIEISQEFSQKIQKGQKAEIGLIGDGRKSNSSQIAIGYIQMIIQSTFLKNSQNIVVRNWYNPNLENFWWIVPNLIGSLTIIVALILTSLSVARERELGTFEQISVAPLSPMTLIIGKTIPPMVISIIEAFIIFLSAIWFFQVPFLGSFWILFTAIIAFVFSVVGFGLFISSISSTQQQGILGAFIILVPSILMSGFATPVENMPSWLVPYTDFVALKYFLILVKGVFLKDISWDIAIWEILPMIALGVVTLGVATWFFKKKVT